MQTRASAGERNGQRDVHQVDEGCREGGGELEALLHLYGDRVLPFGLREARIAGALSDGARAKGRPPGFADIIIAATASAHDLILLTRNQRHFKPLGVETINPFDGLP